VAPQPAAPEPPAPPLWAGDAARERVVVWHEDAVLAVAFGPDVLITGGRDGTARVWRPDGEAVATLAAREWVLAVAASGDRVVTAGRERGVRVWEVATATEVVAVRCDLAWDVAFSPDGATLATAGADGAVGLWEAATGHKLAELAHGAPVTALRFSDDGLLLATASGGDARVWSLAERRELVRIDAGAPVRALAFSADHRPLALTGGAAFPTRVLDVHDGGDSLTLAPAGMRVAAFDATGQRVAAAGAEPEVVVFDARSGAELGRIPTPAVPSAIAFRPDGHALAIGARDGGTRVWTDVATPAPA
jgi:WD40 repeat protein